MVIATGDGQVFKDLFDQLSQHFWPAQESQDVLSSGRDQATFGERFQGQASNDPRNRGSIETLKQKEQDSLEGLHHRQKHEEHEENLDIQREGPYEEKLLPHHIDWQHGKVAEGYPNPFEDIGKYTPKAPTSAPEPPKPLWPHELLSPTPPALWHWEHHTDTDHHVPLIASGTLDEHGNMTGLAIDHRVDVPKEYLPHLALHEATEIPLMHNYMADGMSAQDAYHKAHDIATAIESASVRAYAARNGMEPDEYQDRYKQFFRDAATTAAEPSGRGRHPQAHTTVHGLDEAELKPSKLPEVNKKKLYNIEEDPEGSQRQRVHPPKKEQNV